MLFFTFVCYDGLDKMSDYDMKKPVWRPVMKQNFTGGRNREIAHWNQNNLINTAFKSNNTTLQLDHPTGGILNVETHLHRKCLKSRGNLLLYNIQAFAPISVLIL